MSGNAVNTRGDFLLEALGGIYTVGTIVGVMYGASYGTEAGSKMKTDNVAESILHRMSGGIAGAAIGGVVGGPLAVYAAVKTISDIAACGAMLMIAAAPSVVGIALPIIFVQAALDAR